RDRALPQTLDGLKRLHAELLHAHKESFGQIDDLLVGLQLTHSGRFARPIGPLEPQILYHHPILDQKFGIAADHPTLTDDEISQIIEDFIQAARLAWQAGFTFVDVKHCHGYLGHEFLTAIDRPGPYGGDFVNRTRFLREIVTGIRSAAPELHVGLRLSLYDFIPFQPGPDQIGQATAQEGNYPYAFGGDGSGSGIDLSEPFQLLELCESLGIELICLTAGSPYYVPHIQRPAIFPPSDGYQPPEDPLMGVARLIDATAQVKARFPNLIIVGSGYSYLQDYLPHVAQQVLQTSGADSIGLGRMMLSYPTLAADVLAGQTLDRRAICRTFSDCTTAPRNGLISGCYPLDPYYKALPEAQELKAIKTQQRNS
ncbi:MAG: NADH:flavin oxidoreductase, partial [Chloroflexi bacterium]|nr:NADH:flavin oxidoreductase [Chloroflexota bacterium]